MQQPNQQGSQTPGIGFFDQNAQPPQYSAILGQFTQQGQVRLVFKKKITIFY